MKDNINPKVIFIGAGPANIFAALELLSRSVDPNDILIIEKGNSSFKRKCPSTSTGCRHCRICNIVHGFGGAGMFSDGKLEVDRLRKFDKKTATRVFEHMGHFGLELISTNEQNAVLDRLAKVQEILKPYGLDIQDDFISQHIGTNLITKITRKIELFFTNSNVRILFNHEVCKITHDAKKQTYDVYSVSPNGVKVCFTSKVVVAGIGKSSHHTFEKILNEIEIEKEQKPPIVGIRYEFPKDAIMTISKGLLKDPLIFWKTPLGDEITTYCTCHRGRVVPYFTGDVLLLGGHAMANDNLEVTNFGMAFIANGQRMVNASDYSYSFAKLVNAIGGNKPVIQTYGDFLKNTINDQMKPHRTSLKYYVYGNLNFLLPKAIAEAIQEFIQRIAQVDNRFKEQSNILSAPIIEFVSPALKLSQFFESDHENLFFSGETSGKTFGIVTSAGSGIRIAEAIAERLYKTA